MYRNHTIAVVVPAYNEETLISRVIETMPEYVDRIVVVDDDSRDGTAGAVRRHLPQMNERLHLIRHETNQGVGGAIAIGYWHMADSQCGYTASNLKVLRTVDRRQLKPQCKLSTICNG